MVITAGFGPANSGSIPDMSFKLIILNPRTIKKHIT